MKNLIVCGLLSSTFVSGLSVARAEMRYPAPPVLEVSCRDPRPLADAGLMVQVYRLPNHAGAVAYLSELSIRGPVPVGSVRIAPAAPLVSYLVRPTVTYAGPSFALSIQTAGTPGPEGMQSYLRANVNGTRLDQDMLCNFVYHTM